jgi:hypothetical protein
MSISVQFSYPAMSVSSSNNNSGFFTYTNPSTSTYVSFKPTTFIVSGTKLYINHVGPAKESNIYVVFNLENNLKANPIIYGGDKINLNSLISDELERGLKSKFGLSNSVTYKHSDGVESNFSSGTHVFEIAGTIQVNQLGDILSAPTLGTLSTSRQIIRLTTSSFATDDIICDTGEVSKTAAQEYSTKVAGTIGLNIGIGLMVILLLVGISIFLHKKFDLKFEKADGLFGGWNSRINTGYGFLIGAFFIISFSCFMAYGVRMGKDGNKTDIVTGELTSAIIFLILPVVMLWLKGNVLIEKGEPVAAATPTM